MSYNILNPTGKALTRSTVQNVTNVEINTEAFKQQCKYYNPTHLIYNKQQPTTLLSIEQNQDFIIEYQKQVLNNNIDPREIATEIHTPDTVGDPQLNAEISFP